LECSYFKERTVRTSYENLCDLWARREKKRPKILFRLSKGRGMKRDTKSGADFSGGKNRIGAGKDQSGFRRKGASELKKSKFGLGSKVVAHSRPCTTGNWTPFQRSLGKAGVQEAVIRKLETLKHRSGKAGVANPGGPPTGKSGDWAVPFPHMSVRNGSRGDAVRSQRKTDRAGRALGNSR